MQKREKGITLVALVITIIILLILAGISISALTNQGLFTQAQNAKNLTEEKTAEENAILANYLEQMEAITGGSKTLASKVQPGDYVTYTPDPASTDAIITELGTYSGSTANTSSTLKQEIGETGLKWRVLDVVDGKVRLISELPTTSTVALKGYNGYNNAVYLLDKTCKTLYSKAGYSENVQNLKIEDIQKYMTTTDYSTIDSSYGKTNITPSSKYYPSILLQEEGQTVTTSDGTTQPTTRLGLSEQETPINQTTPNTATSWTVKYTYWNKEMVAGDFTNSIYYNLFINNGSNYSTYWMSSRCFYADSVYAGFRVSRVKSGGVGAFTLYYSHDDPYSTEHALRPVVTLNSNVLVKSGEGRQTSPYEIYVVERKMQ